MDNDQLIGIIEHEIDNSSREDSSLSDNRKNSIDYYHGVASGKLSARDGKSQVVDTVLADAVEWMMPQLLQTFVGSDEVVRFDPESAQDERQAQVESDYVNHVVRKENNAFLLFNTLFRDALLLKNCIAKTYWDDFKNVEQETYKGLNLMEYEMLLQADNIEILEQEEYMIDQPEMMGDTMIRFNVRLMRTTAGVTIDAIPVEEFGICSDHTSLELDDCRFCFHETVKTASELVEQGFDRETVESLPSYEEEDDQEDFARNFYRDDNDDEDGNSDPSSRRIHIYEIYLRVDQNDDGVSELYQIVYAGKKILSMEECDRIPFSAGSAIPQGHRFDGLSFYDRLKEIQEQKTQTWRQVLDNMYQVNNVRTVAVQGKVNLDDLLSNRSGGVIRAKNVNSPLEAVAPLQVQPMFQHGYQMLEYLDQMGEARSGVGANMQGQTQAMSGDTAHGIERIMSASEMLVGNVIRSFAETIVKDIFLKVRELLIKHQDYEKIMPLGSEDIPVNPSTWKHRNKTTVKVGLGTGDRLKQVAAMREVLMFQEKLAMAGATELVNYQKVYNALQDYGQFAGLQGVEQYFIDPSSPEGQQVAQQKAMQPPPEDPNMKLLEVEKIKAQGQLMKSEADAANKQADQQLKSKEIEMKMLEMQIKHREIEIREQELGLQRADMTGKYDMERYKVDTDAAIETAKLDQQRQEAILDLQKERDKLQADLDKAMSETSTVKASAESTEQKIPEIHIHNGGKKRVVVNRTPNGLEGLTENIDDLGE